MKKALIFLFVIAGTIITHAQTCSTCGKLDAGGSPSRDVGPSFSVSLGSAQYTESAGYLIFSSSLPDPMLFTPAALQFTAPTRTDMTVITTNLLFTNTIVTTNISADAIIVTNINYITNYYSTNSVTNLVSVIITNVFFDQEIVFTTNTTATEVVTIHAAIRQVNAPQMLADIPVPSTANGYVINFYYASQVGGANPDGTYAVSGTPFVTWVVTNPTPATINQLQISEIGNVPNYGLMKQWTYAYAANTGAWSVQDLGGVQENMVVTNLNPTAYQVINSVQYSSGPVVQQTTTTYTNFSWGVAPIEVDVGSGNALQRTTYAYNGSGLLQAVTHPDGSWEYYNSYDANGRPLQVYSSFGDVSTANYSNGRQTTYTYNPSSAGVSASGDNGTANPNVARRTITYVQGQEISRSYTVFPSVNERLDIQCAAAGAAWNASGNLVTTNFFYTGGPNQFALQSVIRPDGTMTTYNYITNGTYQTNITITGQPDSTCTYIVDGVSNVTVLNNSGYNVSAVAYDVPSGILLSQDTYGNFDSYGRPQQVTHLDGTTEYTQYACCGLDSTTDRDGLTKTYLYDDGKRQIGYETFYQGTSQNPIMYQNVLDAAGRTLQSVRIGSDNSSITLSQSAYDLAGELIAQTNTLGGVTTYSRTNAPTGGLIRTTAYPNGGTRIEAYYADGSLKSVTGTAVHGITNVIGVEYVSGVYQLYTQEIKLNTVGSPSSEWTKTYTDFAGRTYKTVYASASGTPASVSYYNSKGQLASQVDPDGVTNLYAYNAKGELAYTAADMNGNGTIDFTGNDRITYAVNDVTTDHSTNVRRTRTFAWGTFSSNTSNLVSIAETSTDGLTNWQTVYRDAITSVTTQTQTAYSTGGGRSTITIAPDGSYTINAYSYGRPISTTRYDSLNSQLSSINYAYDAHGRQNIVTDARNGATTYSYNNADQVNSVTTPVPGNGQSAETTTTLYDNMMRPYSVIQPDGTTINTVYLSTGELGLQYGSRTYPVGYGFDYAGRMKTMTNWSNFSGGSGARVTTWKYDGYRGFLTNKVYDGGAAGPSYAYSAAGRLASRTWARGITTTYKYDNAGSLTNVSYSDSTPGITNTYDRLGRLSTVARYSMTDTLTYNLANELLGESFSGGTLNGLSVTNGYDAYLRRVNLALLNPSSSILASASYGYDAASRLSTVSTLDIGQGTLDSATYSYVANSPLINQIVFAQNGNTRMTASKTYDNLNRLTQVSTLDVGLRTLDSHAYNYNNANQRVHTTLADGSYWIYSYDSLGQVTGGKKYWSDGTPVAGQQFDYTFDTIGNRTQTQSGGDQNGGNLRLANYHANNLNQLTNRDVPAYVDVKGVSFATNTVTVNGQTAYRKVEYFRDELGVNNSSSALWTNIITAATGQTSITGNVFVAKAPEQFSYDADGNLTNDGRFNYTWDGENRLINLTSLTNAPIGSKVKLDFAYDYQGRRIQKIVSTNNGSAYVAQSTNKFLYDGWNLIAEVGTSGSLVRSYVWGSDLSGSMQGTGGVGGLLEVSYYGSSTNNCFTAYDGNGNVAALVKAADGTIAANYEYGPFGEVIRATGPMAKNNPFRFSTKYQDDESDLLYYGYRYYKPLTGTWPNHDPIGELGFGVLIAGIQPYLASGGMSDDNIEQMNRLSNEPGGPNLYGFCANSPLIKVDRFGLDYNWGPAGPITSTPGAYGPYYNPHPDWFNNPADEGKSCCCKEGPSKITVSRTDTVGLFQIVMKVDLNISGCYEDLAVIWDTCWRYDNLPWGSESSGAIPGAVNSTSATFNAYGMVYITHANIRYLSCEGGKWTKKVTTAGRTYTRSLPGLPWSY